MNRLKQLREEKQLKQKDVGKILNLEIAAISKFETGRVPLKDDYIIKLADFFEVSIDYLLCKTNIRNIKIENNDISKDILNDLSKADKKLLTEEQKKHVQDLINLLAEQNKK